jgi:NAD(P)-dependent dehydrogenase (short-subunit alcohol dehydrogenase family)
MGFSSSPKPCVPSARQNGKLTPLQTLGGANGVANEINNLGLIAGYAFTPIETLDESEVRCQFETNVFGLLFASRTAVEYFGDRGGSTRSSKTGLALSSDLPRCDVDGFELRDDLGWELKLAALRFSHR